MDENEKPTDARPSGKTAPTSEREARLAAALRANLRRRKARRPKPGESSEA